MTIEKFIIENLIPIISGFISLTGSVVFVKLNQSQLRKDLDELKQSHIFAKQQNDESSKEIAGKLGNIEGQLEILVKGLFQKK